MGVKISEIAPGEGWTGNIEDEPVAIYFDGTEYTVLENICKHAGCQTEWNPDEEVWDCLCHGSRYDALGRVMRGPALESLPRLDFEIVDDEIVLRS